MYLKEGGHGKHYEFVEKEQYKIARCYCCYLANMLSGGGRGVCVCVLDGRDREYTVVEVINQLNKTFELSSWEGGQFRKKEYNKCTTLL